ncbi:MAG: SDR family NAD(P)-dependent oxidoreductase [Bacteroidales bacterium]|nr:SDR family NAD(P)-dependent oxidoreductase [Bacteroidales bacterium]
MVKWLIYPTVHLNENKARETFANRWVVVTGASRGIGEALVRRLIAAHANLFLIARSEERLTALCTEAHEAGCEASFCAMDLRDKDKLEALCENLKQSLPHVDYLFCNAGKSIHRNIIDATDRMHDYDRTIDVNYRAHVALSLALIPKLSESKGHIIYTSSVSTLFPPAPGWSAYHASKCAANTWYETAHTELEKQHIVVQVAFMPLVHTDMSEANPAYRNLPAYTADEAACQLLKLSTTNRFAYKPWWARISAAIAMLFSPLVKLLY